MDQYKKYFVYYKNMVQYTVDVQKEKILIYSYRFIDPIEIIDGYHKIFIGYDPEYEPEHDECASNTILIHISKNGTFNKYIHVGDIISSFVIDDKITNYFSPTNNNVHNAYGFGIKNTYLLSFHRFIENIYMNKEINPYDLYKNSDTPYHFKPYDAEILHRIFPQLQ